MGTRARDFSRIIADGSIGAGSNLNIADILPLLTTANVVETANLYFTNLRVFSNVELASINILSDVDTESNPPVEGQALIWDGNVWAPSSVVSNVDLAGFTTDDLAEGNVNLYFTNARSRASISPANPTIIYDPNTGLISANLTAVAASANTTDTLPEGFVNLYFTNARAHANLKLASINDLFDVEVTDVLNDQVLIYNGNTNQWISSNTVLNAAFAETANTVANLGNFTTDDIPEGANNLYYTNLRVETFVSNLSINVFSDVNLTDNLENESLLKWNGTEWVPSRLVDFDFANVAFANVQIDFVERSNIANIALTAVLAANAIFADYAANADYAVFAETANTVLFSSASGAANTVASIDNFTTDDLREGVSNLYYTNSRVYSNIELTSINVHSDVYITNVTVGAVLRWDGSAWVANTDVASATSAGFAERSNIANIALFSEFAVVADTANVVGSIGNFTTDDLPEGANNFYYSNAKIATDIQAILTGQDLVLDDLILRGDLTVQGNTAAFLVSNLQSESRTLLLNYGGGDGTDSGIEIYGANASMLYNGANDSFDFNKNLYISGNIIPSIGGRFNLGAPGRPWRSLFLGTQTLYLGNLTIGEGPDGGFEVKTPDGRPADVELGNVILTNVSADRLEGNVLTFFSNNEIIIQTSNLTINGNTVPEIARDSISVANVILDTYSNTWVAGTYSSETGIITLNQDGVYESVAILTLSEDWQDTPIKAAFIPTGTYIVQVIANDSSVGGGHTQEYYSGVMSWYSSDTDSGTADEIALHRAGAGPGNGTIFLRIQRTLTANSDDLKLQIAGTTTNSGTSSYSFKFRRLL